MKHLVIGGRGLIGSALCYLLRAREIDYVATTRRNPEGKEVHYDLATSSVDDLKEAISSEFFDVVYLVAAMSKFADCEGNKVAWHTNVDAPLEIVRARIGFCVFVSSDAVENMSHTAYGRQKAHVETALFGHGRAAVVRPSRIPTDRSMEVAGLLIDVGIKAIPGLTRWK